MKTSGLFLVFVSAVALAACSTVSISTDYDRLTTFEKCKTYAWAPEAKTKAPAGAVLDTEVRAAVDQELVTKGMKKTTGKQPDLYVVYHLSGPQKDARHYTNWGLPQGGGYYEGWAVPTQTNAAADKAKAGALVLDFVDPRRLCLVWRSVAPRVIEREKPEEAARVQEAVKAMLAGFPPKAR